MIALSYEVIGPMNVLEGELREVDSEVDLVVEGHHTGGQAAKLHLAHTESRQNGKFPLSNGRMLLPDPNSMVGNVYTYVPGICTMALRYQQCCGSALVSLRIRIRIRIQLFYRCGSEYRSRILLTKNRKKFTAEKNF
jgi:hypothetical protein